LRAGAVFAPLSPHTTPADLARWAKTAGATVVAVPRSLSAPLHDAVATSGLRRLEAPIDGTTDWLPASAATPGTRAGRIYVRTSGSTGEPKAMVIDADRLWEAGKAFVNYHGFVDSSARFLNNLPMSYLGGLFNLALVPMAAGASFVVADAFSGTTFLTLWQDVERFEVSVLWLVPTIVRGLLDISERTSRHKKLRPEAMPIAAFLGTAPIERATKERFEATFGFPLLENWALSETTFLTSERLGSKEERVEASVGQVLPWVQLRVDAEAEGGSGQLHVATPFLFEGYLGADGVLEPPQVVDGFFATGDVGHVLPGATVVLDGRVRDIIKKGGYFVALREVEVLAERHRGVDRAAAVPVSHDFYGEDYVVFVTPSGEVGEGDLADEVLSDLTAAMARHMWPDRVEVISSLPVTDTGKIRKGILADELARRRAR
jgi:acyl-CoA synthetase (AMP-forming)/AMP-acid ligase II